MDYELTVTLSGEGKYNFDWDDTVENIMSKHDLEPIGSGAGFGARNLEFSAPGPLTLETVQTLHEAIVSELPDHVEVRLSYSVWPEDETVMDGPVESLAYPEGIYA